MNAESVGVTVIVLITLGGILTFGGLAGSPETLKSTLFTHIGLATLGFALGFMFGWLTRRS